MGHPISHAAPHKSYKFSNVLYVPSISRNILSISQFCHENNVQIGFLPTSFHVKEFSTGKILLQGPTKYGVYEWYPSAPTVNSTIKSSVHDWHHRLGHLSISVLKTSSCSFPL